jgi:drug/metabolite transporter (DMT)-like permease
MILGFFFKEPIGWRRWLAVCIGLTGTLFIVKPSAAAFNIWALLALAGATTSALREIANRQIHGKVPTMAISFSSLVAITVSGIILALLLGDRWAILPTEYFFLVCAAAVLLSIGSYFAVSGFRNVDIATVAPFRYVMLIWGLSADICCLEKYRIGIRYSVFS